MNTGSIETHTQLCGSALRLQEAGGFCMTHVYFLHVVLNRTCFENGTAWVDTPMSHLLTPPLACNPIGHEWPTAVSKNKDHVEQWTRCC